MFALEIGEKSGGVVDRKKHIFI